LDTNNSAILVGEYGDSAEIIDDYSACCMSNSTIEFYKSMTEKNDNPYIIIGRLNPSNDLFSQMD